MVINITEEVGRAVLESEKHIADCIAAGRNEPDRSSFRSAWNAIGFYLPRKKYAKLVTTWRR